MDSTITFAPTGSKEAARAVGRCYGALFFSVFGAAWLMLAFYAFGSLTKSIACFVAAGLILLAVSALSLQRRGKEAAKNAYSHAEERSNGRAFGILNAITWITVALLFQILPRVGYPDLVFPATALIVGLHFFPMPALFRHRSNLVTGASLTVWAILCPILFKGDRMIGFLALGAGVVLWISAAWALKTANRLFSSVAL